MLSRSDVQKLAKNLAKTDVFVSLCDILLIWLQIALAFALYALFQTWWAGIALFAFIGARQYALLILLHDAQHGLLSPNKRINDLIAIALIAAPCGTIYANSRRSHLAHHQHLGQGTKDPSYELYCSSQPEPKKNISDFARFFFARVAGKKFLQLVLPQSTQHTCSSHMSLVKTLRSLWPVALAQIVVLATLTWAVSFKTYILFWFLPLVLLVVLLNDFRFFCEHSNPDGTDQPAEKILISYHGTALERFFLAPCHMNYHAEHHLFPYVPHRRLPELQSLLKRCPEYADVIQWRRSYFNHFFTYLRTMAA